MKRGFSLIELLAAVLIGSMLMLMIAGSLRGAIRSWTSVQQRVAVNYNRRTVLELIKRQSASLFLKRDAERLMQTPRFSDPGQGRAQQAPMDRPNPRPVNRAANRGQMGPTTYELPAGTDFFKGAPQELSFISTVSFLSDFPGNVAVRYYVVQGGEEEDVDPVTSRTTQLDWDEQGAHVGDSLQGGLYLVLEEKNLFLSATTGEEGETLEPPAEGPRVDTGSLDRSGEGLTERDEPEPTGGATVLDTHTMRLLGPLRKFALRYRIPKSRQAQHQDTGEDWAEDWNLENEGYYPSAVEFILLYENPGVTDDLPDEELDGIRMVIPIYDTQNLMRGGGNAPF